MFLAFRRILLSTTTFHSPTIIILNISSRRSPPFSSNYQFIRFNISRTDNIKLSRLLYSVMYFDLFLPFPVVEQDQPKKKNKQKNKQIVPEGQVEVKRSCWDGLRPDERDSVSRDIALAGHLGYSVAGLTVHAESSTSVTPSPFIGGLPYPQLDPRAEAGPSAGSSSNGSGMPAKGSQGKLGVPVMVQVKRYHIRLDDNKSHCLTSTNTAALREYDIISVQPTTDKALQLACTDLSNPGPNQISIITLPLHEKPYHFRFNRKQIKTAQRNGIMILYSPGLFPSPKTPPEIARRYRQNFLSNAREVVRITGGKGLILSSGCPLGEIGKRGPLDVINLGTMLGMPANLAKDAVSLNPKKVLFNAQARRTYKAIFSTPRLVAPHGDADTPSTGEKRSQDAERSPNKKTKVQ